MGEDATSRFEGRRDQTSGSDKSAASRRLLAQFQGVEIRFIELDITDRLQELRSRRVSLEGGGGGGGRGGRGGG